MAKKTEEEKSSELEAVLSRLRADIRSSRTMLIVFGILAGIVRFLIKVSISSLVILLIAVWLLFYSVYEYLMKRAKTPQRVYEIYFRYNTGDLLLLTFIIHYLGGVEWIGAIFYLLTLVTAGIVLPKSKTRILGLMALFFYSSLVLLEYFEVIPHRPIFFLKPGLYQSPEYVAVQVLVMAAIFYFVAETAGIFSEQLRQKSRQLQQEKERVAKAYQEAEQARKILEVKVRARTKELEELAQRQEEIIAKRTEELQQKIEELEKFHKLAVGRELKMIELKKALRKAQAEIKGLKQNTEENKYSRNREI